MMKEVKEVNTMSIILYPFNFGSIGSELDAFFSEIEERATNLTSNSDNIKTAVKNVVPRITGDFHVDLCETDANIIITCDLPGTEKEDVSVKLLNENTLQIKAKYDNSVSNSDESGTYHLRERRCGAGQRTIHLPANVINEGAKASFKNGIMEITLVKAAKDEGVTIDIE